MKYFLDALKRICCSLLVLELIFIPIILANVFHFGFILLELISIPIVIILLMLIEIE